MAGIEHVFNSGTLEPIEGFSLCRLEGCAMALFTA